MQLTIPQFLAGLAIGSALIGFWIALRFPERGPSNFAHALVHVFASMACGWAAAGALTAFVAFGKAAAFVAIFGVLLPALAYTFLAAAWIMRLATEMIGRYRNN